MTTFIKDITESPWNAATSDSPSVLRGKIQDAIDACAGVCMLLIPLDVWIVDSSLQFHSDSHICGPATIKFSDDAPVDDAMLKPSSSAVTNYSISDLVLDGNVVGREFEDDWGTERPGGSGISTNGSSYGVISRVKSINQVLHGIDVCNAGEDNGGTSDYVSDENKSSTYYPPEMSSYIRVIDCHAENCGDDLMTSHYSEYIWFIRCVVQNGREWEPAVTFATGIEVDDGSRFVWVDGCLAKNVVKGYAAKCHSDDPPAHDVFFVNSRAEECNIGVYIYDGNQPEDCADLAKNITIDNVIIEKPTLFTDDAASGDVNGIAIRSYQNVTINNCTLVAEGSENYLLSAIVIASGTIDYKVTNCVIKNWPKNNTASTSLAAIQVTSSGENGIISGNNIVDCGRRGITYGSAAPIHVYGNGIRLTASVTNSIGIRSSNHPNVIKSSIYGNAVQGYAIQTSYNTTLGTSIPVSYIYG